MEFGNRSAAKVVAIGAGRAAVPAWMTRFVSLAATLTARVRRALRIRRAKAELAALDDRALKDIGIMRHEIDYGVRGRRRGAGDFR
jgi:uncharacterized protein YjiS (DUF1127 family)